MKKALNQTKTRKSISVQPIRDSLSSRSSSKLWKTRLPLSLRVVITLQLFLSINCKEVTQGSSLKLRELKWSSLRQKRTTTCGLNLSKMFSSTFLSKSTTVSPTTRRMRTTRVSAWSKMNFSSKNWRIRSFSKIILILRNTQSQEAITSESNQSSLTKNWLKSSRNWPVYHPITSWCHSKLPSKCKASLRTLTPKNSRLPMKTTRNEKRTKPQIQTN